MNQSEGKMRMNAGERETKIQQSEREMRMN
jgi:hypothetical protein